MIIPTEKTIVVDYKQPTQHKIITFLQYDTNIINFAVEDDGEVADLSNITKIVVNFKRPDRKVISQVLTAIGNEITYQLTDSEMLTPGECELVLQLYDDEERLSIARFKVKIVENIESGEAPTVEEVRLITRLIETVNEKLQEISDISGGAQGERGEDGYTPIKGVDYFDGINGKDGVNGRDGVDGKNGADVTSGNIVAALGYTPVKSSEITWSSVLSKPTTFAPSTHTHLWADISDKPTTFTPSTHTHSYTDLTNKPSIPSLNNTALTGTPTAPTAAIGTNTTQIATTAFVKVANDAHKTDAAPHQYGGKFEWRYNATTNSLDLVVLP